MRISQFKASLSTKVFVSHKSATAVPVPHALARDALIQATFDSEVRHIDFLRDTNIGDRTVRLDAIVLHCAGQRYAVEFSDARPLRDLDDEGLLLLAFSELGLETLELTTAEVRLEPRCSNARKVWRHRATTVPFNIHAQIIGAVERYGALSIREIEEIVNPNCSVMSPICALACDGSLELGLFEHTLGCNTMVRAGARRVRRSDHI